ncbi:MAG: hypothetical protein PHV53_01635 [Fermentimonas sp.]|nr:hypothetical protein [Fermentimonas sp.]
MKEITLQNEHSFLKIDLKGGAYSDFHLKELQLNPINWQSDDPGQSSFKGHFLCFDRWGPPSKGEQKNGFKHHGEVSDLEWQLIKDSYTSKGYIESSMSCVLPMGRLGITREIQMALDQPLIKVTEYIQNLNPFSRMYNIVQHVTLAPPFLDTTTLFDNNSEKGFEDKEDGSLNQESPTLHWPEAIHNNMKINFRQFQNEWPRVSTFGFDNNEKYGWVTACNPGKNLLIGYVWKTADYPWLNFWRSMQNGQPAAFGIEFGTTGLHEPFPIVAKKAKIFDRNIFDYIDADEVKEKSFIAFLAKISSDYYGVRKIEVNSKELIIFEHKTGNKIIYTI